MRITVVFAVLAALLLAAGCGSKTIEPELVAPMPAATIAPEDSGHLILTPDVEELEPGLYAVEHSGDDALDAFLAEGGAANDADVFRFLVQDLINIDELPMQGNPFGCSTFTVKNAAGDGWYFGRNFDGETCDALIVASYPETDYASISTVNLDFIRQEAGIFEDLLSDNIMAEVALYAPLDGMNEKGLCVAVNLIQDSDAVDQDMNRPDLTTTTAVRVMLNKAATVDEAIALLETYDVHASLGTAFHFAIADNNGNAVVIEYVDNEMTVTQTPIATDFYLTPGDKYGVGTNWSHTRYDVLKETLDNTSSMTEAQVCDALSSVSNGGSDEFQSTEWSAIFNMRNLTATYYHREVYDMPYVIAMFPET